MSDKLYSLTVKGCQLMANAGHASEPLPWRIRRWFRTLQKKIAVRTRLRGLVQAVAARAIRATETPEPAPADSPAIVAASVQAGDRVRVRSREQIEQTLDKNGYCGGCAFLDPMANFCGREFRVLRLIDHFFDEARWRMLKCKNLAILDGVHCDGSGHPDTRGCDRMCFFFWRTEWLERVE